MTTGTYHCSCAGITAHHETAVECLDWELTLFQVGRAATGPVMSSDNLSSPPGCTDPWGLGHSVEFEGQTGTVWSEGPAWASVWIAIDGDTRRMVAVRKPIGTRPARQLDHHCDFTDTRGHTAS